MQGVYQLKRQSHGGWIPDATLRPGALSLPVTSLVVGIESLQDLQQDLAIARNFKPMPDSEKRKLLSRVKDEASDGRHELFKSTQNFDGPHHRRQHGFAA
jgi:hypothetical protein